MRKISYSFKNPLSDIPSEGITEALRDLELTEKDPRYKINMAHWHLSVNATYCFACFAGSVIAQRAKITEFSDNRGIEDISRINLGPEDFDAKNIRKLIALNDFRRGLVGRGVLTWFGELPVWLEQFHVTPYEESDVKFKEHMMRIVNHLKGHGL